MENYYNDQNDENSCNKDDTNINTSNASNVSTRWTIRDVVIYEIKMWKGYNKLLNKYYTPNQKLGHLTIRHKNIRKFYTYMKYKDKFLQQVTKTCKKFVNDWTERKSVVANHLKSESDVEDDDVSDDDE